jgi:hypothetical protein
MRYIDMMTLDEVKEKRDGLISDIRFGFHYVKTEGSIVLESLTMISVGYNYILSLNGNEFSVGKTDNKMCWDEKVFDDIALAIDYIHNDFKKNKKNNINIQDYLKESEFPFELCKCEGESGKFARKYKFYCPLCNIKSNSPAFSLMIKAEDIRSISETHHGLSVNTKEAQFLLKKNTISHDSFLLFYNTELKKVKEGVVAQ